jgi:hypothetical protein
MTVQAQSIRLGFGLFFASQGFGRGFAAMSVNAARLVMTAGAGLVAVCALGLRIASLFAVVTVGFAIYPSLLAYAVVRVKPDTPAVAMAR